MGGFGGLNGHSIGIIMKEMVRRAIHEIRAQRRTFESKRKENRHKDEDFVTSADTAAQAIYLKTIRECFPEYGVIGEEENLMIPCRIAGCDLYFTVDPLDGTKAYLRRQSHGIGTMIALIRDGEVVAAAVGDINTQEIYYFRPDSDHVHRLSEYNDAEPLGAVEQAALRSQYVLLRDDPDCYSAQTCALARGLFKSIEVSGGSIGVCFARLWKGEVGGLILSPGVDTPWDLAPIAGISKRLGFQFFALHGGAKRFDPPVKTTTDERDFETLVVHASRVSEVDAFLANRPNRLTDPLIS